MSIRLRIFTNDLDRAENELNEFIDMAEEEYDKSIKRARKKLSFLPITLSFPPLVMHQERYDKCIDLVVDSHTPKFMHRIFKKKMVKNIEKFLKAKGISKVKVEFVKE